MGHWTNSAQQILSAVSGEVTVVDFDTEIIPGSQIALQDGVYDYAYHVNLEKPSGELGPSRITSVLAVKRAVGNTDTIRETRAFVNLETGVEDFLAHAGQTPLSIGDSIVVRVNLDGPLQSGVKGTKVTQGKSSLSLDLAGASASGNFAGTSFPVSGVQLGQEFYRTDLRTPFRWTGDNWLGDMMTEGAGASGTQVANSYLRRFGNLQEGSQQGMVIPFISSIIGLSWTMETGVVGDFEVRRNGNVISTIATGGSATGGVTNLDDNFAPNGVLTVFWNSDTDCADPQVTVFYRRRAN
jgi:hypothetical protein